MPRVQKISKGKRKVKTADGGEEEKEDFRLRVSVDLRLDQEERLGWKADDFVEVVDHKDGLLIRKPRGG